MIVLATSTDLSDVCVAHVYGSGGFRAPIHFAHAKRRIVPDLLCGTSAGAMVAASKACGKLPVLIEHFRELAERGDVSVIDGVPGFLRLRPGQTPMDQEPMAELVRGELRPRDLLCPVAVGVTVRRTRQHAILVLGRDTPPDVFHSAILGSAAYAPFLRAQTLPRALPRIPAGAAISDGAHKHSFPMPSRSWCPALERVEVSLLSPITRPAMASPDSIATEIGWSLMCADEVAQDHDLDYAREVACEGVDVDVFAPLDAGSPSDVRGGTLRAREAWGEASLRAPVARFRRAG